jgi:hypothetical protein
MKIGVSEMRMNNLNADVVLIKEQFSTAKIST